MFKVLCFSIVFGVFSSISHADGQTIIVNGKQSTVLDAVLTLTKDKNAEVLKCVPQELKEGKTGLGLKKKDS